jgi:hypothetical protein
MRANAGLVAQVAKILDGNCGEAAGHQDGGGLKIQ